MAINAVDKAVGRRPAKISTVLQRKGEFPVVVTPECQMLHENQGESRRRSLHSNVGKIWLIFKSVFMVVEHKQDSRVWGEKLRMKKWMTLIFYLILYSYFTQVRENTLVYLLISWYLWSLILWFSTYLVFCLFVCFSLWFEFLILLDTLLVLDQVGCLWKWCVREGLDGTKTWYDAFTTINLLCS